jgi:ring-1,2-phenylacetyl-CoA epoxidase subunit PaaE
MHDFQRLTVSEVRRELPDAISVALAVPPALREAFRFKPGQHLAFRVTLDGEEFRRTYSICSGPGDQHLRIAIKRVAGGRFSHWANDTLTAGQTVEALPPAGRFILPEGDGCPRHIVAFVAGVGITPIIAMAKHALVAEPRTDVTLFYGNRASDTILFRDELEELKDRYIARYTLLHVLSRSDADSPLLKGRIDGAKVKAFAQKLLRLEDVAHVFLCGPGSMIKEARNALIEAGLPRERIHHEFFAAGGGAYQKKPEAALPEAVPSPARATDVVAVLDGVQHRFAVLPGEHVVDAAQKAGVRVPYSCKAGMCCTCRCKLLEGEVTMDANFSLEAWELAAGYVLACQSRPLTARVRLDFDQT